MAGKDKTLRWMRAILGGYDLSGDARTFDTLLCAFDEADLSGWGDAVRVYTIGSPRIVGVRGFQALLNDATAGAFTQLKNAENVTRLSILFGGGAEPALGDPAYLLGAIQLGDAVSLDGLTPVLKGDFLPDAAQYADAVDNPFGVVLHPATSLSATTEAADIDQGAASAAGAHANLHILASSGGEWEFTIEHSATGAFSGEEATLMTFTADGSAITSEQQTVAGAVARYVRFVATRTGGSVTPVCTFARN